MSYRIEIINHKEQLLYDYEFKNFKTCIDFYNELKKHNVNNGIIQIFLCENDENRQELKQFRYYYNYNRPRYYGLNFEQQKRQQKQQKRQQNIIIALLMIFLTPLGILLKISKNGG